MNSVDIEIFLAVVNAGTLTEAADTLFISQSTLSYHIAKLEKDVGMDLIERGRGFRTLNLTPDGQKFLNIARHWVDLVHETRAIKYKQQKITLSIGAIDSAQSYILPPIYSMIKQFKETIDMHIITGQSTDLYNALNSRKIDIAIGHFEQPDQGMINNKFSGEKMVVVCKGVLKEENNKLVDAELDTTEQVFFGFNVFFQSWYDRWIENRPYPTIQIDTANLLNTFLDDDKKWAIVPFSIANHLKETNQCHIYYLQNMPPNRITYQIRKKDPTSSAAEGLQIFDACVDFLRREQVNSEIYELFTNRTVN